MGQLTDKMQEILSDKKGVAAYSVKTMKYKLEQYFVGEIIITQIANKPNVVTFRTTASLILENYRKDRMGEDKDEKTHIIETAGKLIESDIKELMSCMENYPSASQLCLEDSLSYLPSSLQLFLKTIIKQQKAGLKVASIGQAIMQSCRPKVILAPLQLGLGVEVHNHCGSKSGFAC